MRVNLMIEGQESVSWDQWRALADATEGAGLEGLFRSDHYQSVMGADRRGSLDAWATIAALGPLTERIRLGTMVSPSSFRHPSVLAKSVVTADHTSGGRVELGLGAGWHEVEHVTHGFPFHDVGTRFDVFEEQLEIVARQLRGEEFDFVGRHYELHDSHPLPGPVQDRLPIIIGGSAKPRTVRNAVAWADEYNTVAPTLEQVRDRREAITRASEEAGREPLPLSVMTGCLLGEDATEVTDRAARLLARHGGGDDVETWLEERRTTWVVGTVDQAAERLAALEDAGVSRVMLQNLLHDDLDMVALMGRLA